MKGITVIENLDDTKFREAMALLGEDFGNTQPACRRLHDDPQPDLAANLKTLGKGKCDRPFDGNGNSLPRKFVLR